MDLWDAVSLSSSKSSSSANGFGFSVTGFLESEKRSSDMISQRLLSGAVVMAVCSFRRSRLLQGSPSRSCTTTAACRTALPRSFSLSRLPALERCSDRCLCCSLPSFSPPHIQPQATARQSLQTSPRPGTKAGSTPASMVEGSSMCGHVPLTMIRLVAAADAPSDAVHEPQTSIPRRAPEHRHHRAFRPVYSHRRRSSGVLQVCVLLPRLASVLTLPIGRSIGFSEECLGIHLGNKHDADLGDGDDKKVQQFLARQYYFPVMGTCWESFAGA